MVPTIHHQPQLFTRLQMKTMLLKTLHIRHHLIIRIKCIRRRHRMCTTTFFSPITIIIIHRTLTQCKTTTIHNSQTIILTIVIVTCFLIQTTILNSLITTHTHNSHQQPQQQQQHRQHLQTFHLHLRHQLIMMLGIINKFD
jgi:hypothetical protein